GQGLSIRRHRDAPHKTRMFAKDGLIASGNVPEPDASIPSCRSQRFSVRCERQAGNNWISGIQFDGHLLVSGGGIPKSNGSISPRGSQRVSIRRKGNGVYWLAVPGQGKTIPLVAKFPKVEPFETSQVLLPGHRSLCLQ